MSVKVGAASTCVKSYQADRHPWAPSFCPGIVALLVMGGVEPIGWKFVSVPLPISKYIQCSAYTMQ